MAIKKRGKNWYVDCRVGGRRFTRVVGPSKREALAVEGKIRAEIREGKYFERRKPRLRITLDDLITRYVACSPKHSTRTELMHLHMINAHFGADTPIDAIGRADVDAFQAARLVVLSRRGGTRSVATVNREVGVLRRLLNKEVVWEMLDRNPASGRKALPEERGRTRFLTVDEACRLLASCSPHLRPIVLCALETGMRRGEILNLRWSDMDLERRTLYTGHTKTGIPRHVPISTRLFDTLVTLPRRQECEYVFAGVPKVGKVGKPFHDVRTSFENACAKAGITNVRFHDLRHTAASHMVMAGVPLKTVGEILGHMTAAMTERYSHLLPEHKLRAVEMLPDWT